MIEAGAPTLLRRVLARPDLLLRELAWRWLCGAVLLLLAAYDGSRLWHAAAPALASTGILSFSLRSDMLTIDPAELLASLAAAAALLAPPVERAVLGLLPLAAFCWVGSYAVGRTAVLARFDARLARRPFLLAGCQGFELALGLTLLLVWGAGVKAVCGLLAASDPLMLLLVLAGLSAAAAWAWGLLTTKVQVAMALGLVEGLGSVEALRRAWELPDTRLVNRARRFRKSKRRVQLLVLVPVLVLSLLPSPFDGLAPSAAWYTLLSLLPLAATDAVRLAIFFALVDEIRDELRQRAAALPGVPPETIRL